MLNYNKQLLVWISQTRTMEALFTAGGIVVKLDYLITQTILEAKSVRMSYVLIPEGNFLVVIGFPHLGIITRKQFMSLI